MEGQLRRPLPQYLLTSRLFWTPRFFHQFVGMLAGASTTLGSLAATAGGGEAALWPGLAPRLPEVLDEAGGARWANQPRYRCRSRLAAASEPAQASPQLDRCQLHRGFRNNLKKHISAKHRFGQLQQVWQSLDVGDCNTGDGDGFFMDPKRSPF